MAAKNSIKVYLKNGFYHIYNRGVEKRKIFLDQQDYAVFLSYLKTYLLPKDLIALHSVATSKETTSVQKDKALKILKMKNFNGIVELLCYCLMPNHFHLAIKQTTADGINHFINALGTRYAGYFNRRYHRVGPLFQGVYKAVLIDSEEQLLHLSRYIHLNPGKNNPSQQNSLPEYLRLRTTSWIKPEYVLRNFSKTCPNLSYADFMGLSQVGEYLKDIMIEEDYE
ncbi:transposase [Candidatus Microgenomates bacterium]|nr:transposase [Candidatus Microgenomates bacterium]